MFITAEASTDTYTSFSSLKSRIHNLWHISKCSIPVSFYCFCRQEYPHRMQQLRQPPNTPPCPPAAQHHHAVRIISIPI